MAVPQTQTQPDPEPQQDWNEDQYKRALAHLEQLQDQLDSLRTTIPAIVHSLATPHQSPHALYNGFKDAAYGRSRALALFNKSFDSAETRAILARTRASYAENAELGPAGQVPVFGWRGKDEGGDVKMEEAEEEGLKQEEGADAPREGAKGALLSNEETKKILEGFREGHPKPKFEVEWEEDLKKIKVNVRVQGGGTYKFDVTNVKANGRSPAHYTAHCSSQNIPDLPPAINRWLAKRPQQHDLSYLLNMIAAYSVKKDTACAKCGSLYDSNANPPPIRKKATSKETDWIALHERCEQLP